MIHSRVSPTRSVSKGSAAVPYKRSARTQSVEIVFNTTMRKINFPARLKLNISGIPVKDYSLDLIFFESFL